MNITCHTMKFHNLLHANIRLYIRLSLSHEAIILAGKCNIAMCILLGMVFKKRLCIKMSFASTMHTNSTWLTIPAPSKAADTIRKLCVEASDYRIKRHEKCLLAWNVKGVATLRVAFIGTATVVLRWHFTNAIKPRGKITFIKERNLIGILKMGIFKDN